MVRQFASLKPLFLLQFYNLRLHKSTFQICVHTLRLCEISFEISYLRSEVILVASTENWTPHQLLTALLLPLHGCALGRNALSVSVHRGTPVNGVGLSKGLG